ncbi:elongation factor G [uncultured Meiothermus sp.]|jgi:elongation factor G|uniref:elongation factor G n=1 Tax=uncultured Meiothermus sp. TaxID=157471 RepID=UPI002602ED51|nr:elongation factor G [uncultured Meiothermus sp.]
MIRTVALVGHSGSGKTTLGEALLYFTGGKDRMGKVEEGNTTSDYTPEEKAHRVSVRTAVLPLTYQGHRIYLLDAPGYADFVGEIRGAMEAADAAVVVVPAETGVQIGTERAWTVAERLELPRMVVVTKLEKGGDFFALLEDLRSTLGHIIPAHLPLYDNGQWVGLIDVLHDRAFRYVKGRPVVASIPEDQRATVEKYRNEAREAIIETDEALLEKYLEGGEVEDVALSRAFHEAVRKGQIYPVAIGSSGALIGLDMLLDLVLEALPSPRERWGEGSAAAKVFKVQVDPFMGQVAFARLYRGKVKVGDTLQSDNGSVRLAHLYTARGKDLVELEEAEAGTILALPKADHLHKGMELWQGQKLEFPSARLPDPNVMIAIAPESRSDETKLGDALRKLLEEDPSLKFERNPETSEQILWGMGDLHLETARERLADYGVKIASRPPKIPYRETIRRKAEGQGKHKKQSGGHGQYGDVWLRLEPHEDYKFDWEITGGVIPTKYTESVETGIKEAARSGPLAGYPVIGYRAAVYHGSYHDVDSSDMAFQLAAQLAFRNVVAQASPTLLEPVYKLRVFVPQERVGDILSDMQSRRGRILGMDQEGALAVVNAEAPLAEILEYSRTLSGLTQGTGAYSLEFSHYAEVPPNLAQKVIAGRQKAEA